MGWRLLVLKANEPTVAFNEDIAKHIYEEMPVFKEQSFDDYYENDKSMFECTDRFEYIADDGSFMIMCKDTDPHVGPCLNVMASHSFGEKLTPVYKDIHRVGKLHGLRWYVITHHKKSTKRSHKWDLSCYQIKY